MNPLFTALMGQNSNQNTNDMMNRLRLNPCETLKSAGYNVPEGIANDPRATVMHLMQTGQISNPMMQRILPMMNSLGIR